MAILSDSDLQEIYATFMRELSSRREALDLNKSDLRAAVDATDAWIDANAASFNTSLPLPARTNLTQKQKVELFLFVATRRFLVV